MYITQSRSVTEILYHAKSQRRQEYKENNCVFILFIDPMYFTLMYTLLLLLLASWRLCVIKFPPLCVLCVTARKNSFLAPWRLCVRNKYFESLRDTKERKMYECYYRVD